MKMSKILKFSFVLFVFVLLVNTVVSASGIDMNLSSNSSASNNQADNAVYGANSNSNVTNNEATNQTANETIINPQTVTTRNSNNNY